MNSRLFASLEQVIEDWAEEECESPEYEEGDFWWPQDMAALMARAASAVYDANASGQHFAKEQTS